MSEDSADDTQPAFESRFRELQIDTQTESADGEEEAAPRTASVRPKDGHGTRLKLKIDPHAGQNDEASGGILFSPGGSEAYMFTQAEPEEENHGARPTTTPREIRDPFFMAGRSNPQSTIVGQSDDGLGSRFPPISGSRGGGMGPSNMMLQDRLDSLKQTLDRELRVDQIGGSVSTQNSTAESSPRRFPRLPADRDEFLQDPDSCNFTSSEAGFHTENESAPLTPYGGTLSASERAFSPSVASVVSMTSSTASGQNTARRNLEWDPVFDMGVEGLENIPGQPNAAHSLSELERLAIGNYSDFLRVEPEARSSKVKSATATAAAAKRASRNSRQQAAAIEEELRQVRLHKFADSLIRQRELRKLATRRRSTSRESQSKRSDRSSPRSSPSREQSLPPRSLPRTSPMKSSSLNDLCSLECPGGQFDRSHRSNSDVSQSRLARKILGSSGPSSCSSSSTVVPRSQRGQAETQPRDCLQPINTDPQSLPLHIQALFKPSDERQDSWVQKRLIQQDGGGWLLSMASNHSTQYQPPSTISSQNPSKPSSKQPSIQQSQTSLNSRQSASRSFETVINLGPKQKLGASKGKWTTQDNLNSDTPSMDTEDEVEAIRRANAHEELGLEPPMECNSYRQAWSERAYEQKKSPRAHRLRRSLDRQQSSRTSSVATTSDDERQHGPFDTDAHHRLHPHRRRGSSRSRRVIGTQTASSTMESAQIDRAKSFEYFPGESFPLQENSSSYEYLPGHLVHDRPGTVASIRADIQRPDNLSVSGVNALSQTESSFSSAGAEEDHDEQDVGHYRCHPRDNPVHLNPGMVFRGLNIPLIDSDLQAIAEELEFKSKELFDAHMRKTQRFYRRVKKYIDFVSIPAATPQDSRKKQEILDRLLKIMSNQEARLQTDSSSLSIPETPIPTPKAISPPPTNLSSDEGSEILPSEPPTRKIETRTSQMASVTRSVISSEDASSHSNATILKAEPTKASKGINDLEVALAQRQKIDQMRKLRKEIKKMERLEHATLKDMVLGNPAMHEVIQITDLEDTSLASSDQTSLMSSTASTFVSSKENKQPHTVQSQSEDQRDSRKIPAQSKKVLRASKTNINTYVKPTKTSQAKAVKHVVTEAKSVEVRTSGQQAGNLLQSGRRSSSKKSLKNDTGQTYHTLPREKRPSPPKKVSKGVQTPTKSAPGPPSPPLLVVPKEPLAYYLPMSQGSPIKVGRKILHDGFDEDVVNNENRSILANYMAGLNSEAIVINGTKKKRPTGYGHKPDQYKYDRDELRLLTLQDALSVKRPGFLQNAERRRTLLKEMREQRLTYEAQKRKWFQDLDNLPVNERRFAHPCFEPLRVRRIFKYREMIKSTREKYKKLPEVREKVLQRKKRNSFRGHQIMRDLYKKRLQQNVLKGRVSLEHHKNVVEF
ncbi:hypothetical protein TCAL_02095 [Tigriopus californicus]|uniref:ALMS motif domain-containing protein n=2 Tax=Tigriopus californicus TaxID=6832 RepID=A0A553NEB4_TIGCA|nr:hypothetical protein TCAL_02095 [Tigriopus californicus]|eukprot:TCALIF_02095-PA protein Name:"Protein of unknown function" AED:0.00 eAED:0.00 QI:163/1/1/1/1/1/3/67/1401